ncbi:hypothetical protein [Gemmata massiliana]|uniref:hypothetical protein n=1 Tax=Gemmata massiliana TaxID=1210884 RepID=UPI0013A69330|nr:hypothetical protein [Gemmata massiliana]
MRRLDTLGFSLDRLRFQGFESRFRQNLAEWLTASVESAHSCFDNLALSGGLIHDLYTRTAATSAAEIAALTPQGAASPIPLSAVATLHIAINGRFTLNPTRAPAFDGFTALDWARERRPERLFVQVGHNHGLYEVGSRAIAAEIDRGTAAQGTYWEQWGRLAADLAVLPPEIGLVLVALLPKVGAVANLRARGETRAGGYADTYEPVFAPSTGVLSGDDLAAIDARIRAANDQIRQIVSDAANRAGTGGRVVFLDMYAQFERNDYKNSLDPARQIDLGEGVIVDNRYIDSAAQRSNWFHSATRRLVAGGLQSIDGMHPTGCGYALLASEAMAALGVAHDRQNLLRRGFACDTLLTQLPGELGILVRLLGVLRDLDRLNQFVGDRQTLLSEGAHLVDMIRFMRQVFIR